MSKKYLLYIHDSDKFSKVDRKSALVNSLLENYWQGNIKLQKKYQVCSKGHAYIERCEICVQSA